MSQPENQLESSLNQAMHDPAHRTQFYRDVLEAEIFALTIGTDDLQIENNELQKGAKIQFQAWDQDGVDWLPIFSSLSRLKEVADQGAISEETEYLQLNARSFFEITKGANIILNPNLECSKDFIPSEISSMLDGSIFTGHQKLKLEEQTKVLIGQPENYPTQLANALIKLFQSNPKVKAAYLAHIYMPGSPEDPHTMIAIDIVSDWESIVREAGAIAQANISENELVDFLPIKKRDDLSDHLINTVPAFYKKTGSSNGIGSWLKNMFSNHS